MCHWGNVIYSNVLGYARKCLKFCVTGIELNKQGYFITIIWRPTFSFTNSLRLQWVWLINNSCWTMFACVLIQAASFTCVRSHFACVGGLNIYQKGHRTADRRNRSQMMPYQVYHLVLPVWWYLIHQVIWRMKHTLTRINKIPSLSKLLCHIFVYLIVNNLYVRSLYIMSVFVFCKWLSWFHSSSRDSNFILISG